MSNNGNHSKGSSMAVGVIAFAIIVAIIVIFFTVSGSVNGGSPAKPVKATEAVTEVADNESDSDSSDSSSSTLETEDESDVEEVTEAEEEDEPVDDEEAEEATEAEDEEAEEGIVSCPNCENMASKLERFKPSEDYDFFKLWCADCRAEIEDGTKSVDDIDFESDVECDSCEKTFTEPTDKNSIKTNGLCRECYQSYCDIMAENGVEVL